MRKVKPVKSVSKSSGAILIARIRDEVKRANTLFSRRDAVAMKHNKFAHKHKWNVKNRYAKQLDKVANELAKVIKAISTLEDQLKQNKDWELFSHLYHNIMNKHYILTNHLSHVNKDSVQHKPSKRKANLARPKRRNARNRSGRG